MTAHVSPVEALQREIDAFRAKKRLLKGDPARAGITIHVPVFEAMLELALEASFMLLAEGDHMTFCDKTMGDTHKCTCGADDARVKLAKLIEVLQR